MCFKMKFTPKKDYVVKKERQNIEADQMEKILKRWGERISIEKIRDYIDIPSVETVDVCISETLARALHKELGYFKNSTYLKVKVPDFSLNHFLSLSSYKIKFENGNIGIIGEVIPRYKVNERKLITEWVKAGCPTEWGVGEKERKDSKDMKTKEMKQTKLSLPYFDIKLMEKHKFKLTTELVPSPLWYSSLYQIYKKRNQRNKWRKIKEKLFKKEAKNIKVITNVENMESQKITKDWQELVRRFPVSKQKAKRMCRQ